MWTDVYVAEKLRELDEERSSRHPRIQVQEASSRPVVGRAALIVGRALHRAGEGLESWASASDEREQPTCC
jgi:hypothetical protein